MRRLGWVVAVVLVAGGAGAEGLYTQPVLRVETGGHTATIWALSVDAAGRYALTVSPDKTARVWRVADGELLRVLRVPIGVGDEGELYAGALSPDGRWAAVGGWTEGEGAFGTWIYLFERASGQLVRRLAGPRDVVTQLSFSADGRRLAATTWAGGAHIYAIPGGERLATAGACTAPSYGVAFTDDGFMQSCRDGRVRAYRRDGTLRAISPTLAGGKPQGVAIGPRGEIAVGFFDAAVVQVLDGRTLEVQRQMAAEAPLGASVSLSSVVWSEHIFGGGRLNYDGGHPLVRWRGAGDERASIRVSDNTVTDLAPLPDGAMGWAAMGAWGVVDASGRSTARAKNATLDPRGATLRLERSGGALHLQGRLLPQALRFDARQGALRADAEPAGLAAPVVEADGLTVHGWKHTRDPKLGGELLSLERYETSRSLSVAPGRDAFALGTDWYVRLFDRTGRTRWKTPTGGIAWAVNHSGDGRWVVAALDDGTLRWYRARDGENLLSLYIHPDLQRWIAWTPGGYYDAAPGAEELLGWHVNRGPDREADFYPAAQYRDRYFCPAMIPAMIEHADEAKALAAVGRRCGRLGPAGLRAMMQAPVVEITAPQNGEVFRGDQVTVRAVVRSPSGLPARVSFAVDGRQVRAAVDAGPAVADGEAVTLSVPMPRRDAKVAVWAETEYAHGVPAVVALRYGGRPPVEARKPNVYVLAVGVGQYEHPDWTDLTFAATDAAKFARRWQGTALYGEVEARVLLDGEATKGAILDGLDWLSARATKDDVAVVYLAGHGRNNLREGGYNFLPHDADPLWAKRTWLPASAYQTTLASLPGKALLFLDTCHAAAGGSMVATRDAHDLTGLINELASAPSGVVVYSATTGRSYAQESAEWGGGAFTWGLVRCMGRPNSSGAVTHQALGSCVADEVNRLTGGDQKVVYEKPPHMTDFPIFVP